MHPQAIRMVCSRASSRAVDHQTREDRGRTNHTHRRGLSPSRLRRGPFEGGKTRGLIPGAERNPLTAGARSISNDPEGRSSPAAAARARPTLCIFPAARRRGFASRNRRRGSPYSCTPVTRREGFLQLYDCTSTRTVHYCTALLACSTVPV